MQTGKTRALALITAGLTWSAFSLAAPITLSVKSTDDFKKSFEIVNGQWTPAEAGVTGFSPRYYDLPGTKLEGHLDDAHTYFVVHAINMWRYAVAGTPEWDNYTLSATVKILDPAPLKGPRPGQGCVFMNYQWGREAVGSDAALVVRYAGADTNYMVRLSSGYDHVELWKTKGGVVRVKPFAFEPGKDYRLAVTVSGNWIVVAVDGQELIRYHDSVEPIATGRAGLAVRESKVSFADIQVTPAELIKDKPPAHKANFAIREWVGRRYIFDGDEPIAHFKPETPLLEEVKLVPGLMPFCTLPGSLSWGIDWKTNGQFKVIKEGSSLSWTWTLEEKDGLSACVSTWTLTYDPKTGYVWDHQPTLTALADSAKPWHFDLTDPCFYQTVAPATKKMPACRTSPNYAIWTRNDGKIGAFPANHQFKNGSANGADLVIKQGGFWMTTVDDWGAVFEVPADNPFQMWGDYCHWGLDQHIAPSPNGMNGTALTNAVKKGQTFAGHVRIYAYPPAKVKALLASSVPPASANTTNWVQPMLIYEEPVSRFSETVETVAGDSRLRWLGRYSIDKSIGHAEPGSMRIDGAQTGASGENSPWLEMGSSYRSGPYTGMKYRIGMWVKADQFKGKVAIKANSFIWPVKKDFPEQKAELDINGACGWTHVSFESDFPRLAHIWHLFLDVRGEGTVWIDDVEMDPIVPGDTL